MYLKVVMWEGVQAQDKVPMGMVKSFIFHKSKGFLG